MAMDVTVVGELITVHPYILQYGENERTREREKVKSFENWPVWSKG
jgi:hypothetical protein